MKERARLPVQPRVDTLFRGLQDDALHALKIQSMGVTWCNIAGHRVPWISWDKMRNTMTKISKNVHIDHGIVGISWNS